MMGPAELTTSLSPELLNGLRTLFAAAQEHDGHPPFSDQTWAELRAGTAQVLACGPATELSGAAVVTGLHSDDTEPVLVELVVAPSARRQGYATAMIEQLTEQLPAQIPAGKQISTWAHGGHPAAEILATRAGLSPVRNLWKMALPTPTTRWPEHLPEQVRLRSFVPGQDDAAWLKANAAAFADHPEQGRLTQTDLEARMAEDWFDAAGFFLAERIPDSGATSSTSMVLGFHWTKRPVGSTEGEVYAVGIIPEAQGTGLGRALTAHGLNYLADAGVETIVLYVDAENTAAVRLYQSLGFDTAVTDIMYVR